MSLALERAFDVRDARARRAKTGTVGRMTREK
jgi:hypothetical protein